MKSSIERNNWSIRRATQILWTDMMKLRDARLTRIRFLSCGYKVFK
jgi:hypothetical protein